MTDEALGGVGPGGGRRNAAARRRTLYVRRVHQSGRDGCQSSGGSPVGRPVLSMMTIRPLGLSGQGVEVVEHGIQLGEGQADQLLEVGAGMGRRDTGEQEGGGKVELRGGHRWGNLSRG